MFKPMPFPIYWENILGKNFGCLFQLQHSLIFTGCSLGLWFILVETDNSQRLKKTATFHGRSLSISWSRRWQKKRNILRDAVVQLVCHLFLTSPKPLNNIQHNNTQFIPKPQPHPQQPDTPTTPPPPLHSYPFPMMIHINLSQSVSILLLLNLLQAVPC